MKSKVANDTVIVLISSDFTTLGEAATQEDLDVYAQNLANHLRDKFKRDIEVAPVFGYPRGEQICDDEDIAEYVTDLQQGDGWVDLLG